MAKNTDPIMVRVPFYQHPVANRITNSGDVEFYYRYYTFTNECLLIDKCMELYVKKTKKLGSKVAATRMSQFIKVWKEAQVKEKLEMIQVIIDKIFKDQVQFDKLLANSSAYVIGDK